MKILSSHNDYWCERPIIDALTNGCNMFEVDIVSYFGEIYLSHGWRPLPCMMYGTLDKYVEALENLIYREKRQFYLYIEFKSGGINMINRLYQILKTIDVSNLNIVVGCLNEKWYHRWRYKAYCKFLDKYSNVFNLRTIEEIKSNSESFEKIKLYKH